METPRSHERRKAGSDPVELADIVRACPEVLRGQVWYKRRALRSIVACRTAELGGHLCQCDNCRGEVNFYNSCWNRNCPKCQGLKTLRWADAQKRSLLPCNYRHASFSMPEELNSLFLFRTKAVTSIMFKASSHALKVVTKRHFGGRIGHMSVLHTWTESMRLRVHVHCLIPEGGLSPDGNEWLEPQEGFFAPEVELAEAFRAEFLRLAERKIEWDDSYLLPGVDMGLLTSVPKKRWLVFCKRAEGGAEAVVDYLSRNVFRTAILNPRILSFDGETVTFRLRLAPTGEESRVMRLGKEAFLKRFLLHVLPPGVMRVRYYGILANRYRKENIERCGHLIAAKWGMRYEPPSELLDETWQEFLIRVIGVDPELCRFCGVGHYVRVRTIPAKRARGPDRRQLRKAS